jgi:hypothetical protein
VVRVERETPALLRLKRAVNQTRPDVEDAKASRAFWMIVAISFRWLAWSMLLPARSSGAEQTAP